MSNLKLIGEIKEIRLERGKEEIEGRTNNYKVDVKITNTFHPDLQLPKGIKRRVFTVKRKWVYPYIPEIGCKIGIDGNEIGVNLKKISLYNKLLFISLLPELGGRIYLLQYRNHEPIQSPLLYGRKAYLFTAGISEDLGEETKMGSWKFDIIKKTKKSLYLECKKKGWNIKKNVSLDNNIIYQEFKVKRHGRKKKADITFNETLSLIPDINRLSIYIPTKEKLFLFTPSPITIPWDSTYSYYSLKDGLIGKSGDTAILWSTNMKDIDKITIRDEQWLLNITSTWGKLSLKKGETKLFKSILILGEDIKIDERKIGIKCMRKWLWVRDGKLVN